MTAATFETVPLASLALSPLNARYGRAIKTDDLETSIQGLGRLLQPLNCYREGDQVLVWDGGRRLAACQALAGGGKKSKLPEGLKAGLPCWIDADADAAQLRSMATFVREGMHPADEFLAYKALFDQGMDEAQIAAACAVRTPRVHQLLRLIRVAPAIVEAFAAGKLDMDAVEVFSITDDHALQLKVFNGLKKSRPDRWAISQELREGSIRSEDALAAFVGRDAYVEAGGRILVDLFGRSGRDETWKDGDLVQRLADDKFDALAAQLLEAGWAWAEQAVGWDWNKGYERAIEPKDDDVPAETKAGLGVFLKLENRGDIVIIRGWRKAAKGKASTPAGKMAVADPALYGYGHVGHAKLTQIAMHATRAALVANPEAAYDATLTAMTWAVFRVEAPRYGNSDPVMTNPSSMRFDRFNGLPDVHIAGDAAFEGEWSSWDACLPKAKVAFCDYVAALSPAEKAKLLAVSFAKTLHAGELRFDGYDRRPQRWAHLGWMAKHAGVDIAAAWTPDAEFLKGGSKPALLKAIEEMGGADGMSNAKKGELVTYAANLAAKTKWVPKLLATFTDVADPAPAAAAEAPIADDELDDGEGVEEGDEEGSYPE